LTAIRQVAYVVGDLDLALAHWVETLRVAPFFVYRNVVLAECVYDGSPSRLELSVAMGNAGPVQIELIQQHGDTPSIYRDAVGSSAHHVAVWTSAFDRDLAAFRARGLVDLQWGSASGEPDERFVYFAPGGPGPMLELVEVHGRKADRYRAIAEAASGYDGVDPVRVGP
jgi:Glyoxalase/Bleomycin resistance protein/Dioxygenase superfamily